MKPPEKPPTNNNESQKSELEAAKLKLVERKYTLEHIENVEGEEVFIYRKPVTLNYPPLVNTGIDDPKLQSELDLGIKQFNDQVVIIDSLGRNDEDRHRLYAKSPLLAELGEMSKLSMNSSLNRRLFLMRTLRRGIKDENIKSKLKQKDEELLSFERQKKFNELSLPEKIEYMEYVDAWFIEALDILFSTVDKQTKKE